MSRSWPRSPTARVTVDEDGERRTIVVDDLSGTAHQRLGAMPNTVHVIDADGTVRFRAMWNDPDAVDTVLRRLLAGRDTASVRAARFRPVGPATMLRVLRRAGRRALWDFTKAFPSVARWHLWPPRRRDTRPAGEPGPSTR